MRLQALAGAQLFSMYVGEGEALLRDAFQRARLTAPAIIFIDEIDAIVGAPLSLHPICELVLVYMLTCWLVAGLLGPVLWLVAHLTCSWCHCVTPLLYHAYSDALWMAGARRVGMQAAAQNRAGRLLGGRMPAQGFCPHC